MAYPLDAGVRCRWIIKGGRQRRFVAVGELPQSIRLFLRTEAVRRNRSPEDLLGEILAGGNPLPPHISELIREVLKARLRGGAAE